MDVRPPRPAVPAHSSKRRSLPSASEQSRARHRSANHVRNAPASPEVISSLIDSLSAISAPAHHHFETLPTIRGASVSTPPSPSAHGGGASRAGFGVEHGNSKTRAAKDDAPVYSNDAAEPPVIRLAKPPSGFSAVSAPRLSKTESCASLRKSFIRAASRSTTSLPSARGDGDDVGSVDTSRRAPSVASRESSESRRNSTGIRSLLYKSSRDRVKTMEDDRRRLSIAVIPPDDASLSAPSPTNLQPPSPKRPVIVDTAIQEEPPVLARAPPSDSSGRSASPYVSARSSLRVDDTGNPANGRGMIPERNSSLRHHSPSHRKTGRKASPRGEPSRADEPTSDDQPAPALRSDEEAVKQTTKRIQELRKQKEIRDRESSELTAEEVSLATSTSSPRERSLPPPPAPSSGLAAPEAVTPDHGAKVPEVLSLATGVATPRTPYLRILPSPPPPPSPVRYAETTQTPDPVAPRPREVSSTISSDYRHALEVLDRLSASDKSSTRTTSDTHTRRKSVGGRSAAGRRVHETIISRTPTARDISLERPTISADDGARPRSRQRPGEARTPRKLSRNISNAKKRWSQPDLPARNERRSSVRGRTASPAGRQSPGHDAPIDERPSSVDSIDREVDTFLHAPRLSQKVRHPHTGRIISFSEVGDPSGHAVFCCVGMGLTRFVAAFYDELATSLKLRLITPDRPGIGESQRYSDGSGTPLSWPEDVIAICQALHISKFSLLAHSAGAIYALATALRIPQHIRGRVHLLAPWIPPSQMSSVGLNPDAPPGGQLPKSQRFLRVLPTPFLKVANSGFMSATSASVTRSVPKSPQRSKRRSDTTQTPPPNQRRESFMLMDRVLPNSPSATATNGAGGMAAGVDIPAHPAVRPSMEKASTADALVHTAIRTAQANQATAAEVKATALADGEQRRAYDARLTMAIWDAATLNANPAVDLLVCLERTQPIGFRYVDVSRAVTIHHGSRDTRVPAENVKWLGRTMRRCEVRILEGEGHGLMASAVVMGNVLTEISREWNDWSAAVEGKGVKAA